MLSHDSACYHEPLAVEGSHSSPTRCRFCWAMLNFSKFEWCANSLFYGEWIVTVGVSIKRGHEKKITHFQNLLLIIKAVGYLFTIMTHDLVCVETNIGGKVSELSMFWILSEWFCLVKNMIEDLQRTEFCDAKHLTGRITLDHLDAQLWVECLVSFHPKLQAELLV